MQGKAIARVAVVAVGALCAFGGVTVWEGIRADRLTESARQAWEEGRFADAGRLCEEALDLRDGEADIWAAYGYSLARQDRAEDAVVAYDRALELRDGDADTWVGYGYSLARQNRTEDAVVAYDRALAIDRDHAYAIYCRLYALFALGRDDEALADCDRAIALDYEVGNVQLERARILLRQERFEEGEAAAQAAVAAGIDSAELWNTLGNARRDLGRYEEAADAFATALERDPSHTWAGLNHALALSDCGRYEDSLPVFDAAIADGHRVGEAHFERGRAYLALGRIDEALDDFALARKHGDEPSRAWVKSGDALVEQQNDEAAVAAYREALAVNATWGDVSCELGKALRRLGRTDEAQVVLDDAVAHGDRPVKALIERGRLQLDDLQDAEAAAIDLDRAVELEPDYVHARTNRGWLRESQEDWEGALEDYSVALDLTPDDVWAIGACGRMHDKLGHPDEAFAAFERAIRMDPVAAAALVHDWRRASESARGDGERGPDLRLVQGELNALRRRPFLQDVPYETETPESFGSRVAQSIDASTSAEQSEGQTLGLRRLGLMRTPAEGAEDVDLKDSVVRALETQAAAYYDPERDTFFYVAEGMPADMLETVAAHELVHALQDQHEDLATFLRNASRRTRGTPRNDDRVFAYRAVTEGEATFVQFAWQSMRAQWLAPDDALRANAMIVGFVSGMDTRKLLELSAQMMSKLPDDHPVKKSLAQAESIPPYILEPFLGAYFKGAGLCNYQYSKHGWDGIDALYDRPPESAEQVLHPVRYEKKRDRPTPISLPDLGNVEADGWTRCDAATHGELYLRLLLTENGVKPLLANRAADGWDGDVYAAYRRDDRVALVLLTTWDKEKDANQFADALRATLLHRAGAAADAVITTQPLGDGVASLLPPRGPLDRSAVLVRGREVLVADGWPEDLLLSVLERLERHPIDHVD